MNPDTPNNPPAVEPWMIAFFDELFPDSGSWAAGEHAKEAEEEHERLRARVFELLAKHAPKASLAEVREAIANAYNKSLPILGQRQTRKCIDRILAAIQPFLAPPLSKEVMPMNPDSLFHTEREGLPPAPGQSDPSPVPPPAANEAGSRASCCWPPSRW